MLLRNGFGAQVANLLALLLTAVANTALNRRYTFGVLGGGGAVRHQAQGLLLFGLGLVLTSGSLATLHALDPAPARAVEVAVLVGANLFATLLRFLLFRGWVFRRAPRPAAVAESTAAGPVSAAAITTPDLES